MFWTYEEIVYWLISFLLGAASGLAWLLRSASQMTTRAVSSSLLNSGLFGITTAILCREYMGCTVGASLAFSLLAGIGGITFVEITARSIYVVFRKIIGDRYQVGDELRQPYEKDGKEIFDPPKKDQE